MVNNKKQSTDSVIELLRSSDKPLSGEHMAEILGVSRVAVWKAVGKLKEEGYSIESGRTGYRLTGLTEKPLPREMNEIKGNLRYFDEIDSTMMRARLIAESGCSDGTTVIAGRQSRGISRSGGEWKSPDGGLYFSRIRTRPLPSSSAGLYCTAMTAAAASAVRELYSIDAALRWPNEITVDGRKLGGILTRFEGEIGEISTITAGIGINADIPAVELPGKAVSIAGLTGKTVSIRELLSAVLDSLGKIDDLFTEDGADDKNRIINFCQNFLENPEQKILFRNDGTESEGTISGINENGSLIVRTGDRQVQTVNKGENYHYV